MNKATRASVSTFGALAGLMGIEHGIGEVLQGSTAPAGIVISSWPGSELFQILNGEPAMTVVPNLLLAGVLAILFSLIFLSVTLLVPGKHSGLFLFLSSAAMLLAGGGFGPPLLGIVVAAAASRVHAPFPWLRAHLPAGVGRLLIRLWPWFYAGSLISWLGLFPGTILLDHFVGVRNPELVVGGLFFSAFGLLLLTIVTGFARDAQQLRESPSPTTGWQPVPSQGR